jgi:prophage regulatory protein
MSATREGLLRLSEVVKRTGLSRSEIYRRIKAGRFPRPRKLGPKVIAWPTAEIALFCEFPQLDNEARDLL